VHHQSQDAYWTLYTVMTRPQYRLRLFYLPGKENKRCTTLVAYSYSCSLSVTTDLSGLLVAKHQFRSLFESHLPVLYAHFVRDSSFLLCILSFLIVD
jgi:hypothetical protein